MTTVRQILRCAKRLGQLPESGARAFNRSARCASTQTQQKVVENENGKRIFSSPYGEYTFNEMYTHEYVWKNLPDFADKTALVCSVTGRKYTYSQARDAANYIARSLLSMGLKKGDVVALVSPNYPETVLSLLGVMEADLVVTTVNPFYTPEEISRQLKNSGTKAVITVTEIAGNVLASVKGTLKSDAAVIVIDDGTGPIPEGTIPFTDLVTRGKTLPPLKHSHENVDDVVLLPYSSGTTGMPKGVKLTHKNLVANMDMTEQTVSGRMWDFASPDFQEVIPMILPFFHIFGLNSLTLPRLSTGTQIITVPKFVPELFIKVLTQHKITGIYIVPPLLLFFNASPYVKKELLQHLHHCIIGAAPLSNMDVMRFYDKFQMNDTQLKFCQGYGMTETSPVCFFELSGTNPGSIGKNIKGCEARLVDPLTNKDVHQPGETGEIWVKGPHIMKGYLNNETATKDMITEDGWLKTGDIGYYDKEQFFYVTDRLKELIKVKGFQVAPAELEALLRSHPDIQEAAVIGVPDQRCGEVPKAFVIAKDGKKPTEDDVKSFLKGKVASYKELQGGVTFVDNIPKSASGKILRVQLKNMYK
ncbi:uncharacterized protein LOC116424844 [Nomia melanderi]|uniref:uncharacterized protein LOC116424844 n=1 Tax=Nomia melanderi TaxID=2448451 RepID=UPI001304193D|nr:4-coumarate--CoA ligase 1-like [Nomia melanderi]XP_031827654.1 4-coumarate--CoA ligase 1-like [Nomia melanderi]XP_031827655.1 4-coumarate--CoA ligase 1-like [Nomia melanderi]XP_031827656.1 4-coumarate--CoA ligase 1-like [Nomia melanderi]